MKNKESPAVQFLRHIWDHQGHGLAHSWSRLNAAMQAGLALAIGSGMEFFDGDFELICHLPSANGFNAGYWIGTPPEGYYSRACCKRNVSACKSFEAWQKRKPFILKGPHAQRIHVGSKFAWGDERQVTVTSFAADGSHVVACTYHDREEGSYETKIKSRIKITLEMLREHNKQFAKKKPVAEAPA